VKELTLALWQTAYAPTTAQALLRLDAVAEQARAQGADLLICPEMSLTGYAIGPERVAALAEPTDGGLARAVASIACRHRLGVVYGYPEWHPSGERPYNAAQFIGANGHRLAHYRKTHLYGDMDRAQFSPGGTASQAFRWRGWRLGLLICFDVEFSEAVADLARQGADAVLVPTANMREFDEVPLLMVPQRARDHRVFVAYANACGQEGSVHYGGLSTVANPEGRSLVLAGRRGSLQIVKLQASASLRSKRRPGLASG
jgi:predicted amidohydrolase